VSWVELDGGEDSITGWSSSNGWDNSSWGSSNSWSSIGKGVVSQRETSSREGVVSQRKSSGQRVSSIGKGGQSWGSNNLSLTLSLSLAIVESWESIGDNWSGGNLVSDLSWGVDNGLDNWRVSDGMSCGEDGSGDGEGSGSVVQREASGVGEGSKCRGSDNWTSSTGNHSRVSLTPLSLGSSSLGGSKGSGVFSLGSGDLCSVLRSDGEGKVKDWSLKRSSGRDGGSDWEVGAGDSEAIDGVGHIVDSLQQAVSINVLVGAGGHSIGVPGLSPGTWTAGMTKRELSKLILSMELC
jgi:hypothetical protein